METSIEREVRQTMELIGDHKIIGFRYTSQGYPEIEIEKNGKSKFILISRDAEDNGPGEFFVDNVTLV